MRTKIQQEGKLVLSSSLATVQNGASGEKYEERNFNILRGGCESANNASSATNSFLSFSPIQYKSPQNFSFVKIYKLKWIIQLGGYFVC